MKRYFVSSNLARGITGLCLLVLAGSFLSFSGGGEDLPPPVLAFKTMTKAPISSLAPLAGRSVDQIIADLGQAGIAVSNPELSLDGIVGNDREMKGRAMNVLFGKR